MNSLSSDLWKNLRLSYFAAVVSGGLGYVASLMFGFALDRLALQLILGLGNISLPTERVRAFMDMQATTVLLFATLGFVSAQVVFVLHHKSGSRAAESEQ